MSQVHDRNCASRWNASSECGCGADRVNAEEAERERDDAADAAEEVEAACHALQARMGKLEEAAKEAVSLLALRAVRFSDGVPVGPVGNAHDLLAAALAIREGGEA